MTLDPSERQESHVVEFRPDRQDRKIQAWLG